MLETLAKNHVRPGGIWKYADFYAEKIAQQNRLELGDGGTPLIEDVGIGRELGIEHLFFKREDRNATGSLKGRSLCYQVSLQKQRGKKAAVISTSGNAGIAAAAYAHEAGMKMFVFISPDTELAKVAEMQRYHPVIIKSRRAIRLAGYAAARHGLPNLRPSLDDDSIEGFKSIALEIIDQVGEVDALFTFVTSGSSCLGMYRGFASGRAQGRIRELPRMYAVQSGQASSIAEEFAENASPARKEIPRAAGEIRAGQLGVKHTARKREVVDLLRETGGRGIYVEAEEIEWARKLLAGRGIETSLEGCASLAGLVKLQPEQKFRRAVCVLSGKLRGGGDALDQEPIYSADDFEEVDRIVAGQLSV